MSTPRPGSWPLALGLGSAVAAISSAALVILLAEPLPSGVIAAGRVAVTGVALTVLGRGAVSRLRAELRQHRLWGPVLLSAGLLAVHFGAWIASLTMTSVARSVTLVATQPLFAGLLGRLVGDRAPWALYGGAAVALVGTAIMVHEDAAGSGLGFNLGDGLALLAAAAASGYLVIGRSLRQKVPLRPYLGLVHGLAAVMLAGVVVVRGVDPWPAGATAGDLAALVYLGLVPGVVGHGLINWAVRVVPVHRVALVLLLEPVGAMVLTAVVLSSTVTSTEVVGAGVILLGVALGVPRGGSADRAEDG